jgi:hypothetical protein
VNPAEILDEAASVWATSRAAYARAAVTVGGLLHRYVLACLGAAAGMNEAERCAAGLTRQKITQDAADRLGITRSRVNELCRIWAAADLLASRDATGNPELGALTFASLRCFSCCVRRSRGKHRLRRSRTGDGAEAVALESWSVRPDCIDWAQHTFRTAALEGWQKEQVRSELNLRKLPTITLRTQAARDVSLVWRGRNIQVIGPHLPTLHDLAHNAHHRDIADMVAEIVQASRDPQALADLIGQRLARLEVGV